MNRTTNRVLTIDLSSFPVLVSERLVLRELRPSDAAEVFALRSDPLVMQHVNRPLATTLEEAVALIEVVTSTIAVKDAMQWAITVKGDDAFIGLIGF